MQKVPSIGCKTAKILIVGEAPGVSEEQKGEPFVGASGQELTKMLAEASINRNDCFITNVCKYRPPNNEIDRFLFSNAEAKKNGFGQVRGLYPNEVILAGLLELYQEILEVNPNVIIAFGNLALWALHCETTIKSDEGKNIPTGIGKWRGSTFLITPIELSEIQDALRRFTSTNQTSLPNTPQTGGLPLFDSVHSQDSRAGLAPVPLQHRGKVADALGKLIDPNAHNGLERGSIVFGADRPATTATELRSGSKTDSYYKSKGEGSSVRPENAIRERPGLGDFNSLSLWAGDESTKILKIYTRKIKCVPCYHPAHILRVWEWRQLTVHDLRERVKKESEMAELVAPPYKFYVRPEFDQVMGILNALLDTLNGKDNHPTLLQWNCKLSIDIETRLGHIACIGIAWSRYDALCIPLMCVERPEGYWRPEEEKAIIWLLYKLFSHPRIKPIGQNFAYDIQYIARHWGFIFPVYSDTMLTQHVIFPGTPKDLAYLASLYCTYYCFWKDEGKEWNTKLMNEDRLWVYNCKDAVYTFEIHEAQMPVIETYGLQYAYKFVHRLFIPVVKMMLRGTRVDLTRRNSMGLELMNAMMDRETWFQKFLPPIKLAKSKNAKPWYRSPTQQQTLFYDVLKIPVQKDRITKRPSVKSEALKIIAIKEPLLQPLIRRLEEYRSLGVFLSTFVNASLDTDNRIRCSYNIGGTETFRFSSSEDAFGFGTNLQNIPKGSED